MTSKKRDTASLLPTSQGSKHEGDLGLDKHRSVEDLLNSGAWRGYMPSNIWPLAAERSAASIVLKRWRAYKRTKPGEKGFFGIGAKSVKKVEKVAPDAVPAAKVEEKKEEKKKGNSFDSRTVGCDSIEEGGGRGERNAWKRRRRIAETKPIEAEESAPAEAGKKEEEKEEKSAETKE